MSDPRDKNGDVKVCPPTGRLELRGFDVGPKFRHRSPNKSKYGIEEITGKSWSDMFGRFVTYHRRIDRENDQYYERVVDDQTGDIIHECDEPLSEHVGRASAKRDIEDD